MPQRTSTLRLIDESLRAGDAGLLARASDVSDLPELSDCTRPSIESLSKSGGIDLATAVLFDRVARHPANRPFLERVFSAAPAVIQPRLVGIVPGAFYREHPASGANGSAVKSIVESMGCRAEVIPVASFGSLAENAAAISDWLKQRQDQDVGLVSLSKGAADLKVALGQPGAAELFRRVTTWVSLSGLPQGTPLVGWLNRQPLRRLGVKCLLRWRGQRYTVVDELSDEPGAPLQSWPELPRHLSVLHVVGFPLRRHLKHPWAVRGYERIAAHGPNDGGGFLLAEAARLPGVILPVWGADHYFQPDWDLPRLLRRALSAAFARRDDGLLRIS